KSMLGSYASCAPRKNPNWRADIMSETTFAPPLNETIRVHRGSPVLNQSAISPAPIMLHFASSTRIASLGGTVLDARLDGGRGHQSTKRISLLTPKMCCCRPC